MKKEEILEKSRTEFKNQDAYEKEVIKTGNTVGIISSVVLTAVFAFIEAMKTGKMNYGMFAIILAVTVGQFTYKAVKMKRKHEIIIAVIYWIVLIGFSAAHLYGLLSA